MADEMAEGTQGQAEDQAFDPKAYIATLLPPYLTGALRGIMKLDEESRAIALDEVGKACYEVVNQLDKQMGLPVPEDAPNCGHMTLEEAAKWVHDREHANEAAKRTFQKEVDGKLVTVREREYDVFVPDENTVDIDSGYARLIGGKCSCMLKSMGVFETNPDFCTKCLHGNFGTLFETLTGRKCVSVTTPESPCVGGCDHCHYILHFEAEAK
jgi:hypothetical protein